MSDWAWVGAGGDRCCLVHQVRVMWVTGSNASTPVVRFGATADKLALTAIGNSSTYAALA
jgi:hypothetical protein